MSMKSSNRQPGSCTKEPQRSAWIPLTVFLVVSLMATVALSVNSVVDLVAQTIEIASLHDSEEARFKISPWLRPYFKTADDVRPRLQSGVPLLVTGRHRFFVAYRLSPQVCFLETPFMQRALHQQGVDFVRLGDIRRNRMTGVAGSLDATHVFSADFEGEKGRLKTWSKHRTGAPGNGR